MALKVAFNGWFLRRPDTGSGQYLIHLLEEFRKPEYGVSADVVEPPTHGDVAKLRFEQWEFPKELRQVVSLHHRRPENGELGLLPVVYAGWRIADLSGFSVGSQPASGDISEISAALPDAARPQVIAEFDGFAEEVAFKINAIECSLV